MSIESARAFWKRIKDDEEWRNRLNAAESKEERQAMVKAEGLDFTEDELKKVQEELTDEDLDNISGAGCVFSDCYSFTL